MLLNSAIIDWRSIDDVFLDMDGTLLDLNFDNYFWQEHVPRRYGEQRGLTLEEAKAELFPRFRDVEGTIDWYCLDYWSEQLGLDIPLLKQEVEHLIALHPHVIDFLQALAAAGKRRVLVTNAHMKSLRLKLEKTPIGSHLDRIVCSHDFRFPKESQEFWRALQERDPFDPRRTLLVDDSLAVLRSARRYGIGMLLAVARSDSRAPAKRITEFPSIHSFQELMVSAR